MSEMKPWQHGYDLDYLKALEERFQGYNEYALGPFNEVKKHVLAKELHNGNLEVAHEYIVQSTVAKTKGKHKMCLDVVIGEKKPGDRIINFYTYDDWKTFAHRISQYEEPTWIWAWAEDPGSLNLLTIGFHYVGSKFTSFGEIKSLYFRGGTLDKILRQERVHPKLIEEELFNVGRYHHSVKNLNDLKSTVEEIGVNTFTDHYSNYNAKHSWSAISFRGYTDDPSFITKPSEMSKKWQKEHEHIDFQMQNTPYMDKYPAIRKALKVFPNYGKIHRVRLMRLSPGGGELQRHTDLVDKDSGISDGKLARFHLPIFTNDDVIFTSWLRTGAEFQFRMREGLWYYLDTRKPHRAINGGQDDRVHLVVDVESDRELRNGITTLVDETGTPIDPKSCVSYRRYM